MPRKTVPGALTRMQALILLAIGVLGCLAALGLSRAGAPMVLQVGVLVILGLGFLGYAARVVMPFLRNR